MRNGNAVVRPRSRIKLALHQKSRIGVGPIQHIDICRLELSASVRGLVYNLDSRNTAEKKHVLDEVLDARLILVTLGETRDEEPALEDTASRDGDITGKRERGFGGHVDLV